jgi:hypothetical protein
MPLCDQLAEVLLECISAGASQFHDVAYGYASVLPGMLDDAK